MRRVAQKHPWGCAIACAAMVLDVGYDDVVADLTEEQRAWLVTGQCPRFDEDAYLRDRGVATRFRWAGKPVRLDSKHRRLKPRAAVSLYATSPSPAVHDGEGLHLIVVLRDGTVLDPQADPPPRLADLYVWHVTELPRG